MVRDALKEADMRKHLICISFAVLMIFVLMNDLLYASDNKTSELNRKITEITSLQHSLSEKISLATEKRDLLKQKIDQLKGEIKQEKDQLQVASYHEAIKSPRIEFNLKLIQLLTGYIGGLNQKILYFQDGYQTLDFYLQQTRDDLLMIKTLDDLEIDKLIAQINSVLDEYIPEIKKPIFDTNDLPVKDIDTIWNEIVQPKKIKAKS
jgi:chromosome segregation ATPase